MRFTTKTISIILILFFSYSSLSAQNFGNEWVNHNQEYYRFSISETGMHKVSKSEFISAGVPIGNYNPQQIQLFFKGKEIPCYIEGESAGDIQFIEFFAEENNGWFDVGMYNDPINQTNPHYSIINDTASVFITWSEGYNNKRYSIENDQNFNGYTPASYCYASVLNLYTNKYYIGDVNNPDCEYTEAEAWADNIRIQNASTVTKKIITPNPFNGTIPVTIDWSLITFSKGLHNLTIEGPGFVEDTSFSGIKTIKNIQSVSTASLANENNILFSSNTSTEGDTDFSAVSYIEIKYPMLFKFEGVTSKLFSLPSSPGEKTYIEIVEFGHGNTPLIYDLINGKRIVATVDNDVVKALIPATINESELVIVHPQAYKSVAQISKSTMVNYSNLNKEYIILTHPKLMSEAEYYKAHRNAYVVNVDELYNQFAYGIQKHPMAIRNFASYILNNWTVQPKNLFIIGKGVSASGDDGYVGYRKNLGAYRNCLIPPMGNPPSDVLLTAKTDGVSAYSAIPTGRLAALTPKQVADYLAKVIEFESNEAAEWMKHAIHFGGGSNSNDQARFESYLKEYENYFEDTLFGGYVSTFLKTSSAPIEITKSDSVENLINNGVSIMTFFRHGSTTGFDQNIDDPSAFLNFGKYPLLIANSCHTGNIFLPNQFSTSEDWVLIPNKGTIGFLAVTHRGYAAYLNLFTNNLYKRLSSVDYGKSLGYMINSTRQEIINSYPTSDLTRNTAQEFTLHGDPALVLNSFPLPDFVMQKSSISFSPSILTTEIDSFNLNIAAKNIARATPEAFAIHVARTFSDGSSIDTQIIVNGLKYKENISIKYPINRLKGQGVNSFFISMDANFQVEELSESNNITTVVTFISSSDLIATVPYEYSLIPEPPKALKAVTGDPFASQSTNTFQLDTSYLFSSPFLISENITHPGGVVEWVPPVSFEQNKTYYWRTGKSETKNGEKWSASSFVYQINKSGWLQGDFGQLKNNAFIFIKPNSATKQFDFITTPKRLSCYNIGSPSNNSEYYKIRFAIDEITDYSSCGAGGAMLLVVIDTLDLMPWESDKDEAFGNTNYPKCASRNRNDLYFVFPGNNEGVANLANVVDNYVPNGFYILTYSFNQIKYSDWSEANVQAFESWGAANIRFQTDYTPYIFFTKKNDITESKEVIGTSIDDVIKLEDVDLINNFVYGDIYSTLIGPSQNWELVEWDATKLEDNPEEVAYLKINGVKSNGEMVLLHDSIVENSIDISGISSQTYPYLKLGFHTKDEVFKTPSQLDYWLVQYTPISDLAINPTKGHEFYSDTLQEGDIGSMTIAIENIGTVDVDSVLVRYWLQNSKNENFPLDWHRLSPLKPNEVVLDTISFKTLYHSGNMSLWLEINPIVAETLEYDQPEQNHFNNLAKKIFFIEQDAHNPLLDVTFDGVHIMDGDIVSARPEITIQLKDENPFIAIDDTATFSLYVKSQQNNTEKKISLSNNSEVIFIPAELPKNYAQLIYQPEFAEDGIYELRVRAKDATGNESGSFDYLISFQVINESSITNVFNYPNPFSTSTRFVFELTGSEIPEEFRIDILTVTGHVVKIIYQDDLGPLNIGKNITQYVWDGRDMYGDPLANGVYFYKVSARLNGKELKNRETGTNKFFKNGFGKMYIMR